jgi:hypothetical protein
MPACIGQLPSLYQAGGVGTASGRSYFNIFTWQMNVFMLREILYGEIIRQISYRLFENPGKRGGKKSTKAYSQEIRQTSPWGGSVGQQILK